jgi:hypothetical protein
VTDTPGQRSYDTGEVAAILHVSQDHVGDLIRSKALRAINVALPGAKRPTYRVTEEQLQQFVAARTPTQPTPTRRRRRGGKSGVTEYF